MQAGMLHQRSQGEQLTWVVLMSAQRKQNLRMPSRRRMTAVSDRKMERERWCGCEMRANSTPMVMASRMIPNSVCTTRMKLAAAQLLGPLLPYPIVCWVTTLKLKTVQYPRMPYKHSEFVLHNRGTRSAEITQPATCAMHQAFPNDACEYCTHRPLTALGTRWSTDHHLLRLQATGQTRVARTVRHLEMIYQIMLKKKKDTV